MLVNGKWEMLNGKAASEIKGETGFAGFTG
jgi:hypothetical protein